MPGDYDGIGQTEMAVWRPSTGTWYVNGYMGVWEVQWGTDGDVPVPQDFDGDLRTDMAVWRPSNRTWYVIQSSNGQVIQKPWGVSTDIPMNKPVGQ